MMPQIIFIALLSMDLGIAIAKHGKPKGIHSALYTLIAIIINVTILYFGGFWAPIIK